MADLVITAANVREPTAPTDPAKKRLGRSGEAITAGAAVYEREDGDDVKRIYKADNGSTETARVRGIAMNSAPGANQPIVYATEGDIVPGAALTNGATYYLSGNAGNLCNLADVGAAEYITAVGLAQSTTDLRIAINATGSLNN